MTGLGVIVLIACAAVFTTLVSSAPWIQENGVLNVTMYSKDGEEGNFTQHIDLTDLIETPDKLRTLLNTSSNKSLESNQLDEKYADTPEKTVTSSSVFDSRFEASSDDMNSTVISEEMKQDNSVYEFIHENLKENLSNIIEDPTSRANVPSSGANETFVVQNLEDFKKSPVFSGSTGNDSFVNDRKPDTEMGQNQVDSKHGLNEDPARYEDERNQEFKNSSSSTITSSDGDESTVIPVESSDNFKNSPNNHSELTAGMNLPKNSKTELRDLKPSHQEHESFDQNNNASKSQKDFPERMDEFQNLKPSGQSPQSLDDDSNVSKTLSLNDSSKALDEDNDGNDRVRSNGQTQTRLEKTKDKHNDENALKDGTDSEEGGQDDSESEDIVEVEEDYGVGDAEPRETEFSGSTDDLLSVSSAGSSGTMKLSDDVIIDALFTNLDILQDNVEMCEEGLRQRLEELSRKVGHETYTVKEANDLMSPGDSTESDTSGATDFTDPSDEIDNDGGDDEDSNMDEDDRDKDNNNVHSKNTEGIDDSDVDNESIDNSEEEEKDEHDDPTTSVAKQEHRSLANEKQNTTTAHLPEPSDEDRNSDPQSQTTTLKEGVTHSSSTKSRSTPENGKEQGKNISRKRRPTHENNSESQKASASRIKEQDLSRRRLGHNVVKRLSNRLQYLKESLEECYILYKELDGKSPKKKTHQKEYIIL